jgi:hypothetical protein
MKGVLASKWQINVQWKPKGHCSNASVNSASQIKRMQHHAECLTHHIYHSVISRRQGL